MNDDSIKKLLKKAKDIFLSIKIRIPTIIKRITEKLEVTEKIFFLANNPNNKTNKVPIERINSGNKKKFRILFSICNFIIIDNSFNWQTHWF